MIIRKEGKDVVFFGDDLPDVMRWLAATPSLWRERSVNCSVTTEARENWDMSVGMVGAMRLCEQGWSVGAVELHTRANVLPVHAREASIGFDVAGSFPDVSRFCAGDPLHMVNRRHKPKAPVVHIIVNIVCSAATRATAMMDYGAAVCSLVDDIENSGRRVELDVAIVDSLRNHRALIGWKVKRAQDVLDMSAIAFSLAHPAALRRIGFAMLERTDASNAAITYGSCGALKKSDAVVLGAEDALLIDGVGEAYYNGARNMRSLAAQQINLAAGETLVEVE